MDLNPFPDYSKPIVSCFRAGRWLNVDCLLGPTGRPFLVSIRQGRITAMSAAPKLMPSWRFSLHGIVSSMDRILAS